MTTADARDDDTRDDTLALRRPDVPTTLSELAGLKGEAIEIIEARAQVLQTLRVAAIRATHPEDWLLFKSPDEQGGQVIAYLQDCGCDRVRDLFGIEVFDIGRPEKISGTEPGVFHYVILGSGRCKFTRQTVEAMEGGRSSTDDFCKDKQGAELELAVRKAARANLDGNITRELAGMKSVPVDELARAWDGTAKKVESCRLGRGFGSRAERLGASAAGVPDVAPPTCPHCNTPGIYRPAKDNRAAFYGCSRWKDHPKGSKPFIVDAGDWVKQHQAAQPKAAQAPAKPAAAATIRPAPLDVVEDRPCADCGKSKADHANADHEYEARENGK